jgi:hypothetical protein
MDCPVLVGKEVGVIALFKDLTQCLISVFGFLRGAYASAMSRSVPYFFSSDSIPRQLLKDFGGYCIRLSTSRR